MAFLTPPYDDLIIPAYIGDVVLGQAPVKILSSVCAKTKEEMIEQALAVEASCADIIEWRADWFEDDANWQDAVRAMRKAVTKPVLYTFRTRAEGGVRTEPISDASWRKKVREAIESGLFEAVDIEYERHRSEDLVNAARASGVTSILSWHSFVPSYTEIDFYDRLLDMSKTEADVLKLVAMPDHPAYVADFCEQVASASREINQPVIAMCMGKTGSITRIGSAVFGSSATFASAAARSAPGQLDAETTRRLLDLFTEQAEPEKA